MNYPSLKVMRRKWACEDWAGIIENYSENNLVSWLFRITFDSNKIKRITAICKRFVFIRKSLIKSKLDKFYFHGHSPLRFQQFPLLTGPHVHSQVSLNVP